MILKFNDGEVLDTTPNFNGHVVTIQDANPNTSGFVVYNRGVAIFDASAFRTVYDSDENSYTLSDDGSVKPEPPAPPEPPKPVYTNVLLSTEDDAVEADVIDFSNASDVSFYISTAYDEELLSNLVEIKVGNLVIDLTDGFKFQACEETTRYDEDVYAVVYHKLTEQELVNLQVAQNTANIDYIAMESDIDLEEGV